MTESSRTDATPAIAAVVAQPAETPPPAWAASARVPVLALPTLDDAAAAVRLADVGCVLLDAATTGFVTLARRVHTVDPNVQVVAVAAPERLQDARRALLYAPGLGEVWVASPTEVTGALTERAAGVTRQRRRFERTRARMDRERLTASPQRTERALISDAYLAGLLQVLPDPVFSLDDAGRVLSANAAAEAVFGGGRHTLVGERLGHVLALDGTGADARALLERAARDGVAPVQFRRGDGERGTGELRATPMHAGGASTWAVVLRDVTEQHATYDRLQETAIELEMTNEQLQTASEELVQRTEEAERTAAALRQSEAAYRALADAIPTLAWTARPDGYLDWYNQRWYEYTGTTPADMEGWGWQSVHDPAVLPDVLARWQASITLGIPFEMTFPLRRADGTFRSFLTRVVPLHDADGRIVRWFGTNTDVEAERRARVRVERLQALTAALAATRTLDEVAAVVLARALEATDAHAALVAVRLPGEDDATVVQHTGLDALVVQRNTRFSVSGTGPTPECLRTGEPIFVGSRDGPAGLLARYGALATAWEQLGAHAIATIPLVAGGAVVGAISFSFTRPRTFTPDERDFFLALARQCAQAVERARLFAAERDARERADEANRAKSQFLATMSHELRTPLNAISGHVALVLEEIYGPVTPAQRTALERVTRAQGVLLALVNNVLSFARLESGRTEYHIEAVPASDVVASILPLVEPQLARQGLMFAVRRPEDQGGSPVVVRADRDKLGQILMNLIANAIKFTGPGGQVQVEIATAAGAGGQAGTAALRVSDTGIGIPPDRLDAIFEPFVQVHAELTRTAEGTGLGLAISRDLARGMGGDLAVESTPGVGSTFTVTLPLADAAPSSPA